MFDLIVIGGGPAGVTAALRARELGAGVALVERGRMGGTCTNDGCVPTRVLAKAARLRRDAEQFAAYGMAGELPSVDLEALLARTQEIVYKIQEKKQLISRLEESGVTVYAGSGEAHFLDPHTLLLANGTQLQGEQFIICAGGHARRLDFPGAEYALTHSDVWSLKSLPKRVAIVGAAATGCQLASIFAAFGAEVTLLEIAARILPAEDEHVSVVMRQAFQDRGIQIITGIQGVQRVEKQEAGLAVYYTRADTQQTLAVDSLILTVGWPGNLDGLNLEAAGVEVKGSYIQVDDAFRTSAPHIFAAGDITGRMMLVQSAGYEARVATENALAGTGKDYQHVIVPHGGFTDPEYSSVGLTEAEARRLGEAAAIIVPYADLDRAVIDGHTEGFCKLIVSVDTRQILGAHVVGEQAVEVVHFVAAGMAGGICLEQLAELEIAYPTYTAVVGLAARRLAHELGLIEPNQQWRTLSHPHISEWERSAGD